MATSNLVVCERCDRQFQQNAYSFCTDPWGGHGEMVCDSCQEGAYDREQERLMECGAGPSLIEQQREAWRLK